MAAKSAASAAIPRSGMQLQQHHLGVNFTAGHTCSTTLSERYYDIMATHKPHIAYKTHTKSKIFWLGGIWYRVIGMLHNNTAWPVHCSQ